MAAHNRSGVCICGSWFACSYFVAKFKSTPDPSSDNSMEATEEENVSVDTRDIDLSLLRKSLQARGKTIDQLVNCIYYGTTEVRQYILNESDVIIECKACRNLFRALPNFVAHKRIYCIDSHLKVTIPLLKDPEEVISVNPEPPDDAQKFVEESISLAKKNLQHGRDMSADVELNGDSDNSNTVVSETQFYERICNKLEKQKPDPTVGVRFEPLEGTDVAVRVVPVAKEHVSQQNGITIVQKRKAGSIPMKIQTAPKMDIQTKREIKMKADFKHLRCLECNRTMSSRRYLIEHILNLHSDKRRYYSCPYCKVTFRYFHCVVRHLRRVHECSKDVIDNMREKLRNSSWIENSPVKPTNKVAQSSSSSQQAKIEKVNKVSPKNKHEHHGKVPKLKVKLFGHKTTLSKSSNAHSSSNNNSSRSTVSKNLNKNGGHNSNTINVSALVEPIPNLAIIKQEVLSDEDSQSSTKSTKDSSNAQKDSDVKDMTGKHRPPSLAQKKRMAILMDKKNLTCLQCHRGFSRMSGLVRHVAHHLGWKRFKCRLCMYSGYDRYVCKSHIERNHLGKVPGLTRKVMDYYIVDLEECKIANQDGSKGKKPSSKSNSGAEKKSILSLSSAGSFDSMVKPVTVNANSSTNLSSVATVRLSPLSNEQIKLSKGCATSSDKSQKPLKGSDLKKKLLSMVDYRTLKCLECNRTWNKRSHLLRHAAHHIGWKRFKCKLCVFSGYDRYMCKSHLKRCHLGKIHGLTVKVLDYYIVDMMEEENGEV